MSSRSVQLHSALLVLALLAAWVTFRGGLADHETSDESTGVVLVDAGSGDVERLVYEHGATTLTLESRSDAVGRWFAGTEVTKPAPAATAKAADEDDEEDEETGEAGATAETSQTAAETTTETTTETPPSTSVFPGGTAVEAIWRRLEPFRVSRVLGELDAEKLAELELADPSGTLTLTVRGREHRFELGGEVFGSGDRYARASDGRVLVLPASLVRDLDGGAPRLMERRLFQATRPEVSALEIGRGGRQVRVEQQGGQTTEATWTLGGQGAANADFAAWADKFFRLEARAYHAGDPEPSWKPEATITVASREFGREALEIWSTERKGQDARLWLARSAHTRLVAELLPFVAQEVCEDLDSLLP